MSEWPIAVGRSFFVGGPGGEAEAARRAGVAALNFDGGDLAGLVRAASANH